MIDLYSRRLLRAATSRHPDADLACAAIEMAVAAPGGPAAIWRENEPDRVIFHTDYAEPCLMPRNAGIACAGRAA